LNLRVDGLNLRVDVGIGVGLGLDLGFGVGFFGHRDSCRKRSSERPAEGVTAGRSVRV
jgi:hypothetical protein